MTIYSIYPFDLTHSYRGISTRLSGTYHTAFYRKIYLFLAVVFMRAFFLYFLSCFPAFFLTSPVSVRFLVIRHVRDGGLSVTKTNDITFCPINWNEKLAATSPIHGIHLFGFYIISLRQKTSHKTHDLNLDRKACGFFFCMRVLFPTRFW